jgi:hypothetical protein
MYVSVFSDTVTGGVALPTKQRCLACLSERFADHQRKDNRTLRCILRPIVDQQVRIAESHGLPNASIWKYYHILRRRTERDRIAYRRYLPRSPFHACILSISDYLMNMRDTELGGYEGMVQGTTYMIKAAMIAMKEL